jgi:hypothetical protein
MIVINKQILDFIINLVRYHASILSLICIFKLIYFMETIIITI